VLSLDGFKGHLSRLLAVARPHSVHEEL